MDNNNNKRIEGDLYVRHDEIVGGDLRVRGCAKVSHDLKVGGLLISKFVSSANLGLFATLDELKSFMPKPKPGMYAGVGSTLPADLYYYEMCEQWKKVAGAYKPEVTASEVEPLIKQRLEQELKTVNGQSLVGKGNIEIKGSDISEEAKTEISNLKDKIKDLEDKIASTPTGGVTQDQLSNLTNTIKEKYVRKTQLKKINGTSLWSETGGNIIINSTIHEEAGTTTPDEDDVVAVKDNYIYIMIYKSGDKYYALANANYEVASQIAITLTSIGASRGNTIYTTIVINSGSKSSTHYALESLPMSASLQVDGSESEADSKYRYVISQYQYGNDNEYSSCLYDLRSGQLMYYKDGIVYNTIDNPKEKTYNRVMMIYYAEDNQYYIKLRCEQNVTSDLTMSCKCYISGTEHTVDFIITIGDKESRAVKVDKITSTSNMHKINSGNRADNYSIYMPFGYVISNGTVSALSYLFTQSSTAYTYDGLFVSNAVVPTEELQLFLGYVEVRVAGPQGSSYTLYKLGLYVIGNTDKVKSDITLKCKAYIGGVLKDTTLVVKAGSVVSEIINIDKISYLSQLPSDVYFSPEYNTYYKYKLVSWGYKNSGKMVNIWKPTSNEPYTKYYIPNSSAISIEEAASSKPSGGTIVDDEEDEITALTIQSVSTVNNDNNSTILIAIDQNGHQVSNVVWSIYSGGDYATIDSVTGKLNVLEGASSNNVVVKASCAGLSTSATISVTYKTQTVEEEEETVPTITGFAITGSSTINTAGNVAIYTAKCAEYGKIENVTWQITEGSEYATLLVNNGTAYITAKSGASASTVKISVKYNSNMNITAEKTITVTYNAGTVQQSEYDYSNVAKIINPYCMLYRSSFSDGTNGRYMDKCNLDGYKSSNCMMLVPNATNDAQPWIDSTSNSASVKHSDSTNYRMLLLNSAINKLVIKCANQYYNSDKIYESIVTFYAWSTGNDFLVRSQLHDNGNNTYTIDIAAIRQKATDASQDGAKIWIALAFISDEQGVNSNSFSASTETVMPLSDFGITIKGYTEYVDGTKPNAEKRNDSIYFCYDKTAKKVKLVADYVPTSNITLSYKVETETKSITLSANNYESEVQTLTSTEIPVPQMPNWSTAGAVISEDSNFKYVLATWSNSPGDTNFGLANWDKSRYNQ